MMKSIQVNSLPLKEVVQDIAEALNTNYDQLCEEYYMELPPEIGRGSIRGINFDGGLGILHYDCTFKEDLEIQFIVNHVHPLKFLYCLEGKLDHRFENTKEYHTINQYQSAIVASEQQNGHILQFDANVHYVINSLELDRKVFTPKIECELRMMHSKHGKLFKDSEAKESFYHNGDYSLQMADLFKEMQDFDKDEFLRKLFLEGKAYQILAKQIQQYQDDLSDVETRSLLRWSEVKQVNEAASLIKKDLNKLDTVEVLAHRVGLNVRKLQEGFQHMYGMTVNSYVQKERLELAKELLLNLEFNISEIVDKVGLSSKSYFSKIFKTEFGISPSDFRQHHINRIKHNSKFLDE